MNPLFCQRPHFWRHQTAPPGVYDPHPAGNFERLRVITDDGRITDNYVLSGKVRVK